MERNQRSQIQDWYYRAEGNCSLVIANSKEHVVIRLLKRKKQIHLIGKKQKSDPEAQGEQLQKGIQFAKNVMQPLIGHDFVHLGKLVELHDNFPKEINERLETSRPAHRRHMEIDPNCLLGIQLPDCCFVSSPDSVTTAPTFCIEIKPKCGYMPQADRLSDATSIKSRVCYYCMYQHLKLKTGKWSKTSSYCPIDLFSGDATRMKHALKALFRTPQNNLRLFKDGELLLSQEVQTSYWNQLNMCFGKVSDEEQRKKQKACGVDAFQDLIVKCLLHVPMAPMNGAGVNHLEEQLFRADRVFRRQPGTQFCDASSYRESKISNGECNQPSLPVGCVLQKLLATQLLDDMDIEGVYPLYERVAQHFHASSQNREKSYIDGPYAHFWDQQEAFTKCVREKALSYCINKVKDYLVARTAKDCSIMISLRPLPHRSHCQAVSASRVIADHHGNRFLFSIAVIDLDPKPFDKFPLYIEHDWKVVDYYVSVRDKQQQQQSRMRHHQQQQQQQQQRCGRAERGTLMSESDDILGSKLQPQVGN